MVNPPGIPIVKSFVAPKKSFAKLDADATASVISAAADVTLVLDGKGVIRDLSFASDEFSAEGCERWLGKRWTEVVTAESRQKVIELLRDAGDDSARRWRHINHPSPRGSDLPLLYSAVQAGDDGKIIAIGRDLRGQSALQQRLVNAQQSLERDHQRMRGIETRYRLLFQLSSEAVLVVDAASRKIVEANPAAGELLDEPVKKLIGRQFPEGFDSAGTKAINAALESARAADRSDEVMARRSDRRSQFRVSASLFRNDNTPLFLVRLAPTERLSAEPSNAKSLLLKVVESASDGFVVTDLDGRVLAANAAFVDLVHFATEEQIRGESIERWIGRSGVDYKVLVSNLRQHGSVRMFLTTLQGRHGLETEVEISAVSVPDAEQPCVGFSIRNVERRLSPEATATPQGPRSVEQLTKLVGRAPLKELVRESTDMIERLCIEAALELTGDNRASAAEMLGLSRQSLYVKLRRFGLGDSSQDADGG